MAVGQADEVNAQVVVEVAGGQGRGGRQGGKSVGRRVGRAPVFLQVHRRLAGPRDEQVEHVVVVPVVHDELERPGDLRRDAGGFADVLEVNTAEIAEHLEAGVAGLDGEQVEFSGEIDISDNTIDSLERSELGEFGQIACEAVGGKTVSVRTLVAEHEHVVEPVIVQVAYETARVAGVLDGRELETDRREDGVGVEQCAEGVGAGADEQAVVAVMIEIDYAERPTVVDGVTGEGLFCFVNELDRNAFGVWLL